VPAIYARGGDKHRDEETLRNAATVLRAMLDSGAVPQDLLAKAHCVLVLPAVKKFGMGIGGTGGRGPMSCRQTPNFSGPWSAPAIRTPSDVSTPGRARGLFAGVSMGSATLSPDHVANERLYGKAITAQEIILSDNVQTPLAGQAFIATLDNALAKR
jgi:SH3 domain-containing YSC84-like protein 1